eukprot:4522206-Amphidinium_carterae.1
MSWFEWYCRLFSLSSFLAVDGSHRDRGIKTASGSRKWQQQAQENGCATDSPACTFLRLWWFAVLSFLVWGGTHKLGFLKYSTECSQSKND